MSMITGYEFENGNRKCDCTILYIFAILCNLMFFCNWMHLCKMFYYLFQFNLKNDIILHNFI